MSSQASGSNSPAGPALAEHAEHEGAVHRGEHAVVHAEERDEQQLCAPLQRIIGRGEEHARDVQQADDHVLDPEQQQHGEHRPAERSDAVEREEVGRDEHDDRDPRRDGGRGARAGQLHRELALYGLNEPQRCGLGIRTEIGAHALAERRRRGAGILLRHLARDVTREERREQPEQPGRRLG